MIRERPILFNGEMVEAILAGAKTETRRPVKPQPIHAHEQMEVSSMAKCPMGKAGDLLYVRETYSPEYPEAEQAMGNAYRADFKWLEEPRWTPCVHMPKSAARIWLRVLEVRVERLNEITDAGATAEGITDGGCYECGESEPCGCPDASPSRADSFVWLWNSIYSDDKYGSGPLGHHSNPWVWVCRFEVLSTDGRPA